jgi:hypothetical protein
MSITKITRELSTQIAHLVAQDARIIYDALGALQSHPNDDRKRVNYVFLHKMQASKLCFSSYSRGIHKCMSC